jgi:hypothetical protein
LGQLKLLISEILFLSKKAKSGNKVVYVGAAEGFHIAYLADMFSDLTFDLYDNRDYVIEHRSNIKLFHRYFTQEDAELYSKEGHNILFISDIRNLAIRNNGRSLVENDSLIISDNNLQLEWVQIIKPKAAFLKFRCAYSPGKTKYFDGKIYLQAFSPISTETRLLVSDPRVMEPATKGAYTKFTLYDNREFDEKMFYFNRKIRFDPDNKSTEWKNIMDKYKIINNWDTTYALYVIALYLDKIKKVDKIDKETFNDKVGKEFINIINFLKKKYGKKYDVLFVK